MDYLGENAGKVHFALMNRKMRCVSSADIADICKYFGFSPVNVRTVLIRRGVLVQLLFKGIFYVRNSTELLAKTLPSDPLVLAALACNKRFGKIWYFGLYSALKLNELAGVQTPVKTFIITKKQVLPNRRDLGGMNFVFSQVKGVPFDKGIIENNDLRFSNLSRTALDFLHLAIKKKDTTYAEMVLDTVIARNKGSIYGAKNLLSFYSTKRAMTRIIEKHLGDYSDL